MRALQMGPWLAGSPSLLPQRKQIKNQFDSPQSEPSQHIWGGRAAGTPLRL